MLPCILTARNVDIEAAPKMKVSKVKEMKVLDAKTAQNIGERFWQYRSPWCCQQGIDWYLAIHVSVSPALILGSLRMNFNDIRKLLLTMDEERLTENIVESFVKCLPGKDELIQLNGLKDKYDELIEAEKFGVVVSEIRHLVTVALCNFV